MKKILIGVILFLSAQVSYGQWGNDRIWFEKVAPGSAPGIDTVSAVEGLFTSYWKMEESTDVRTDAAGDNDLSDGSGTTGSDAGVIDNGALFLDEQTDFLFAEDNITMDTETGIFLTGWVKVSAKKGDMAIISKRESTGSTEQAYSFWYNSGTDRFTFSTYSRDDALNIVSYNAEWGSAPQIDTWYFFYCYYDPATSLVGISINNEPVVTEPVMWAPFGESSLFRMGAEVSPEQGFFEGMLDEVGYGKGLFPEQWQLEWLENGGSGRDLF